MSHFNVNQTLPDNGNSLTGALNVSQCSAQSRIREFVARYNEAAHTQPKKAAQVTALDADQIINQLAGLGAITNETLAALSVADLESACGVPKAVAAALCNAIRLGTKQADPISRPRKKQVQSMSLTQLLENYNPKDFGAPLTRELQRRLASNPNSSSDSPAVIVFQDDGRVDVATSEKLIQEYMLGDETPTYCSTASGLKPTYAVGELPQHIIEIHPITGERLRSSGEGKDGFNWLKCSLECRQMLHLAVQSGELAEDIDRVTLVQIYRMAADEQAGLGLLQQAFPEAAMQFMEDKMVGGLPPLRRRDSRTSSKNEDATDGIALARSNTL
jgi:hypothetical protein